MGCLACLVPHNPFGVHDESRGTTHVMEATGPTRTRSITGMMHNL